MLRICLIIALLAGLAAAAVNFVYVKEKITTTLKNLDDMTTDRDKERTEKQKAQKDAKETHAKLDTTTKELTAAKTERDEAVAQSAAAVKTAAEATEKLKTTEGERDKARNELAAWDNLGIPLLQIKSTLATLTSVKHERDALKMENRVLVGKVNDQQEKINSLIEPDYEVKMPSGLKGTVLVADPKYDFAVINIGQNNGARENGKMLVNRNGRLIAKVQIRSLQADRAIVNVIPGWKLDDIMEGDQVVY